MLAITFWHQPIYLLDTREVTGYNGSRDGSRMIRRDRCGLGPLNTGKLLLGRLFPARGFTVSS